MKTNNRHDGNGLFGREERERDFFDNEAKNGSEYWGWRTKTGLRRHFLRGQIVKKTIKIKPGQKILELGCGIGGLSRELVKSPATIFVTDISEESVKFVKRVIKSKNVKFRVENGHGLSFADGEFDAVVGNGILHHMDLDASLSEILRVLKPGGKICFVEPNLLNPEIFIERKVPFARKWSRSSLDEDAHTRWFFAKKLSEAGFANISCVPYDFLYPAIPYSIIKPMEKAANFLEQIPVIREFAGSMIIKGEKV